MLGYWPAYLIIKIINPFLFPLTIVGRENIPAQGAFLVASNHISNMDPPLVSYAVGRPIYHIAKKSLFDNKIFGFVLRSVGAFPIKRETSDVSAMRECLRKLKCGYPLALFPTGTRVSEEQAAAAKGGVGFLAIKGRVPIIPLKVSGTDLVMPKGAKGLKKHPVRIVIGKPISVLPSESYEGIAADVLQKINSLS